MNDEHERVIPVVEERVSTTKREVETGRVRVRTPVEWRDTVVREELARDEVDIERVPVGRPLHEAPTIRHEGDTLVVPVVEEVLVVEKRLMLVEELRITRARGSETVEVPVTLARQHVEIEREESSGNDTKP